MPEFKKQILQEIWPIVVRKLSDEQLSDAARTELTKLDFDKCTDAEVFDFCNDFSEKMFHSGDISEFLYLLLHLKEFYERPAT